MATKTINVPLDELKPGDTVTIPPLTVDAILSGEPRFAGFNNDMTASFYWLERSGATATRKVPDPEYPLGATQAFVAMTVYGKVIARPLSPGTAEYWVRYTLSEGFLERVSGLDDTWRPTTWGWSDQDAKWRIVEGENG